MERLEERLEPRKDEGREDDDGADRHHEDDERIHEGALHFVAGFKVALDIPGELAKDVVKAPGELGSPDHIHVELREQRLVGAEGLRERLPIDQRFSNALEHHPKRLVVGLFLDHLERLYQRDASPHEGRELP